MTRALSNAAATASRTRHHPLERRAFTDNRLLHDQSIRFQVGVVLCVGDCALERLVDQKCRLFRREREEIECGRNRQTLDLTRDFAHLERRNPRILIYRSYFHGFATLKELKKGTNATTEVLFRFNNITFCNSFNFHFISDLHWVAHPPGDGPLLLFFPSPNPFLESPRHKFSAAHQLLAVSRSCGRRAARASASRFSHPVFRQDCQPRTTTRPSR